MRIEADQRHENQVQRPGLALAHMAEPWLGDAETIAAQPFARINPLKRHASTWPAIEHRQVGTFATPLGFDQQRARVYFPVIG
ncbi:hypothetical protein D3C77_617820 [compost metagenome]